MSPSAAPDPTLLQARAAHLQMIQAAVARMAGYSSSLKNFCLTIVAALIAFYAGTSDGRAFGAIAAMLAAFALLDARYLREEWRLIEIYNETRLRPLEGAHLDFALSRGAAREARFYQENPLWRAALSWSVRDFYGVILLISLGFWLALSLPGAPASIKT